MLFANYFSTLLQHAGSNTQTVVGKDSFQHRHRSAKNIVSYPKDAHSIRHCFFAGDIIEPGLYHDEHRGEGRYWCCCAPTRFLFRRSVRTRFIILLGSYLRVAKDGSLNSVRYKNHRRAHHQHFHRITCCRKWNRSCPPS